MRVKICGLTTLDTLDGAINAGAAYVGFVFFEKKSICPGYFTELSSFSMLLYVDKLKRK